VAAAAAPAAAEARGGMPRAQQVPSLGWDIPSVVLYLK